MSPTLNLSNMKDTLYILTKISFRIKVVPNMLVHHSPAPRQSVKKPPKQSSLVIGSCQPRGSPYGLYIHFQNMSSLAKHLKQRWGLLDLAHDDLLKRTFTTSHIYDFVSFWGHASNIRRHETSHISQMSTLTTHGESS